ncbi:hypothetical protein ACQKDB_12265 [Planococcus kocurii]|uniref:hypothetical protein n=1 Tax=Planococcus kocurii TaxID=1374 RepID=UPI003CFF131A
MSWFDNVSVFLYFFSLMYLPWILLAVSLWYTIGALVYESWKKMTIGFLIFLPNLIALLLFFMDMEPLLYGLILLPPYQVAMMINYYRSEKRPEKVEPPLSN